MATSQLIQITAGAAGGTPAVDVSAYVLFAVGAVDGAVAFSGSANLEGSLNGSDWVVIQALTAGMAPVQVAGVYLFMRVDVTSYSSGSLVTQVGSRL